MSGMASFLVGLGGGYIKAKDKQYEQDRQAKLDAQGQELHTAKMSEIAAAQAAREEEQNYKDTLKTKLSAGQQTPVTQGVGDGGSAFDVKDAGVAAVMADMGAAKGEAVSLNDATRVSTGAMGATQNGTVPGKQVIADPVQAQALAKTMTMSDYQKLVARQEVADQFAKMDVSDDMRGKLVKLQSEGAFQALTLAKSGDLEGAAKVYNSTGNSRMPAGSRFELQTVVDPQTQAKTNVVRLVGENGDVIVPDLDAAARNYLTPIDRYKLDNDERRLNIAQQTAETAAKAQETNAKKIDGMLAGLIGGRIGGRGGGGGGSGGGRGGQGESGSTGLPDPMGGFDPKKAYAVATEQAVAELAQGGTPATPEAISRRATAIYRALEGEFKASGQELAIGQAINSMAQMAQTPQQLQVVAQRALAAGYSIEQLAAVNPRFAALAKAKDAGANDRKSTQNPDGKRQDKPASPGVFTDKNGQIQLLQPLMNLSAWRKKMVEEANAEQAARGY